MFQSPFSFDGRVRRTEYGISFIICCIFRAFILAGESNDDSASWMFLAYIPLLWFMYAQGAKRCHDLGRSGFWQLIPFFLIWLIFVDGDPGENQYGINPKGMTYGEGYADVKENPTVFPYNGIVESELHTGHINLNKK